MSDGEAASEPRNDTERMAAFVAIDRQMAALRGGLEGHLHATQEVSSRGRVFLRGLEEWEQSAEPDGRARLRCELIELDSTVTSMLAGPEHDVRRADELLAQLRRTITGDYLVAELARQRLVSETEEIRDLLQDASEALVAGRQILDHTWAGLADGSCAR